jgi:hypothetical protein
MGEVVKILTQELPVRCRLPFDVVKHCIQPYLCGKAKRSPREQMRFVMDELIHKTRYFQVSWFSPEYREKFCRLSQLAVHAPFTLVKKVADLNNAVVWVHRFLSNNRSFNTEIWKPSMAHMFI